MYTLNKDFYMYTHIPYEMLSTSQLLVNWLQIPSGHVNLWGLCSMPHFSQSLYSVLPVLNSSS